MPLVSDLMQWLEDEEIRTVGDAFGGVKHPGKSKSYSVPSVRDKLLGATINSSLSLLDAVLSKAQSALPKKVYEISVENLLRFSFLIELTNLKVGSTKMKTRWIPGKILMSQPGSFEPIQGDFLPGNDPRAATFDDCLEIFINCLDEVCRQYSIDSDIAKQIIDLSKYSSIPYEFVFDYIDPTLNPAHHSANIQWAFNQDIEWLLLARPLIGSILSEGLISKIQTKTYKTDRALTGKDKTNRAKRWEVISGDFQHATLIECWSVERKLLEGLVYFKRFPVGCKDSFLEKGLVNPNHPTTLCPVTLETLEYPKLIAEAVHGRHEYQVGHLHPLKRGGRHCGHNICWQSADGNRIQGDLTLEETLELLEEILSRKKG